MEETFFDKILQKDNVSTIRRLVVGGLMAGSMLLGIPALIAMSAACIALNATVFHFQERAEKKKLLVFYKDEIATLQHKAPADLTLADLSQVAAPMEEGGKGVTSIQSDLKDYRKHHTFRLIKGAVSSVITTGILVGISLANPLFLTGGGLSALLGLGLIGLGHSAVSLTVKAVSEMAFGPQDNKHTVSHRLINIGEDIKQKPVSPLEIFDLQAQAHPKLAEEIKQKFGANYSDMPVVQKKQVVEAYEEKYRIIGLSDEINKGTVKPSLAGFIISDQNCDHLSGYGHYKALFDKPVATVSEKGFDAYPKEENLSAYRDRLLSERETSAVRRQLH